MFKQVSLAFLKIQSAKISNIYPSSSLISFSQWIRNLAWTGLEFDQIYVDIANIRSFVARLSQTGRVIGD